ncbi:MAG: fumarate reductase iron-sulfur subunit, partial [Pseudomonadota bacterium]
MGRKLKFNIFRYNPLDSNSVPHTDTFILEETDSMTLFIALTRIREEQDSSLQFDFCCRAGICGSCAMIINGRPGLACKTLTKELPTEITLMPLPVFKLIGDLSVDTGTWFRAMNEKVGSWIHTDKTLDPDQQEERMDNSLAEEIYELERCVECGCCVASCGTANMREDFMGAVALNRIARFILDPRDQRKEREYFEVIGTDEGIFGCMGLLACEDVCPKNLP